MFQRCFESCGHNCPAANRNSFESKNYGFWNLVRMCNKCPFTVPLTDYITMYKDIYKVLCFYIHSIGS